MHINILHFLDTSFLTIICLLTGYYLYCDYKF